MRSSAKTDYKLWLLKLSTIAISTVAFVELTLGLIVGSLAIVSDGLHATLDLVTTLLLLVTTRASLKPPDEEHMYGHEKLESIGGLTGGIALIGIALLIMYEAIMEFLHGAAINLSIAYIGWAAIGYTFCVNFFRVGTLIRARKSESQALKAVFYNAIADFSSTTIALLGFGLAFIGFRFGDSVASMILGILLSYLSFRLVWACGMELSDTVSKDVANGVRKIILNTEGVRKFDDLKIRRAGPKIFVQATVQVPEYMNQEEAHDIASKIGEEIQSSIGQADVLIHTEPAHTEMPMEKLIERLAMETKGVKGVHEVNISYVEGKLYIVLHVYVNPKLSVRDADTIADKIEEKIEEGVGKIENVAVHLEPYSTGERKGPRVNRDEIIKVINEITGLDRRVHHIKRVVTYVADKKRYINIDCSFSNQVSVEEAHKIASKIEENVKKRFVETIVTVHTESE